MQIESELWEDFLKITETVFVVSGVILTAAEILMGGESVLSKLTHSGD